MHYYKRNLGDYAKKAGRLSMLQHGSYTLLLDACYDREQFPTLDEAIEWTWASTTEEIEAVTFVLRKFFTLEDGVYVQKRIQEEINEYREKSATNKRIARERETKRAENSTKRERSVNEAPPNQEPLTNNHISTSLRSVDNSAKKSRSQIFRPDDVGENVWDGFIAIRKAKRAPISQSAIDGIRRQATKANLTLEAALQICCERGWQGFNADWLSNNNPARSSQSSSVQDARLEVADQIFGRGRNGTDNTIIDITPIGQIASDGEVVPKALAGIR